MASQLTRTSDLGTVATDDPRGRSGSASPKPGAHRDPQRKPRNATSSGFRKDVAGLRAVAVSLVLLYHAGIPFIPAGFVGVDIFFVISGYLITGQLVAEIDRTGHVSLSRFYARRAKRILPAASVVLAATAAGSWLFIPRLRWSEIGGDTVSAAAYFVNWRLAARAVDYLAVDTPPSPVQHFWSLAVEEQFYLLWPVLMIAAILAAKAWGKAVRPVLGISLAVIAVPSFVWSIAETAASPDRAFFLSTTRVWELAIGAATALGASGWAILTRRAGLLAGWLGVAAIVASALLYSTRTAWPGYAAALPTLGAAAVIAAGATAGSRGPVAILGTRPFQWIGDMSYSLYLWHWPMLVIAAACWGKLSVLAGLAVVTAAIIPSWITLRLVENPLRFSRAISNSPRLALSLGANFTMVGVCAGLALLLAAGLGITVNANGVSGTSPGSANTSAAPGATVLLTSPPPVDAPVPDRADFITPDPLVAYKDLPDTTKDKCFQQMVLADLIWCVYGNPKSKTTVALVGDSKADQWVPAFQQLAAQNDWKLVVAFKGACPFTTAVALTGDDPKDPYPDCTKWNKSLLQRLVAERPDYVFTSQTSSMAADAAGKASVGAMVDGMREAWSTVEAAGSKVVVIANNPGPSLEVPTCVDEHRTKLSACAYAHALHDADKGFLTQRTAVAGTDVPMIDLFDTICPTNLCPPVIGNVLVYRHGSHITATYARSLTSQLAAAASKVGVEVRYDPSAAARS